MRVPERRGHASKTIAPRGPHVKISSVADCLFCQIVSGLVPATTVMESNRTLAFGDINPQAPTHVLVITKEHYEDRHAAVLRVVAAMLGDLGRAAV